MANQSFEQAEVVRSHNGEHYALWEGATEPKQVSPAGRSALYVGDIGRAFQTKSVTRFVPDLYYLKLSFNKISPPFRMFISNRYHGEQDLFMIRKFGEYLSSNKLLDKPYSVNIHAFHPRLGTIVESFSFNTQCDVGIHLHGKKVALEVLPNTSPFTVKVTEGRDPKILSELLAELLDHLEAIGLIKNKLTDTSFAKHKLLSM